MIEQVKKFFTASVTLTAILYAIGYIVEQSHAGMLGISLVDPPADYYLTAGGQFFVSTLYALYSALLSHFIFVFVIFLVLTALILRYETDAGDSPATFPKIYGISAFILTFLLFFIAIPEFTCPFTFSDFLLEQDKAGFHRNFSFIAADLRTWVLNGGAINKQKLIIFHVALILTTILSAVMLWSMMRQWKRWEIPESVPHSSGESSWKDRFKASCLRWKIFLLRFGFGLLIVLMMLIVAVEILTVPANYGILLKSNDYPEVRLDVKKEKVKKKSGDEITEPAVEIFENHDIGKESKLWLIRESRTEILLYAVYFDKDIEDTVFRLLAIRKDAIEKIQIVDNSFIFAFK